MNQVNFDLSNDQWSLAYPSDTPVEKPSEKPGLALVPAVQGLQVFGCGTAGVRTAQQVQRELMEKAGQRLSVAYFDYPVPAANSIPVRSAPGKVEEIPAEPFCPVGEPKERRDQAKKHTLLRDRYSQLMLLRGIAVFEDRKLGMSGEGGAAIPSITALDIDLNIMRIYAFMQEQLRWLNGTSNLPGSLSDLAKIVEVIAQQEQRAHRQWIIVLVGGGTGATGNALLQLQPYLVRRILREMGISKYQIWGVVLGPNAFKGLTPFVQTNYQALMYSLDYMANHGLRHEFINGISIDMDQPPFDQVFLMDDNTLETNEAGRVTDAALDQFFTRAGRAIGVLLGSNAWDTVAARAVNPDGMVIDDGKLRWLNTLSVATAGVNKPALIERAIHLKQAQLLQLMAKRLSASINSNS